MGNLDETLYQDVTLYLQMDVYCDIVHFMENQLRNRLSVFG